MDNKFKINLRGEQYREMIEKFKSREEQTSLEEALVYLKLREFECENSRALIFAKKYPAPHLGSNAASTVPSTKTDLRATENSTSSRQIANS
jgi:hypothetical protein